MQLTPHQEKALDYQRHISLTANAGSGKTFILSKRYVEIAVNENISLNNIVAITFTDKASGELNKKIAGEIENRLDNETDKEKIKILLRLRRQLVSANISTIHSFCVNILREFSPEAGLDARFIPIDQTVSDEMIDLSIEESLNFLIRDETASEKIKYLIRFFGAKNILSMQIRQMLKSRRNVLTLAEDLYKKSEEEIAGHFNKYFRSGIEDIFKNEISGVLKLIQFINSSVLDDASDNQTALEIGNLLQKIGSSADIIEILLLLNKISEEMLTQKGTVRLRGYMKKEIIESMPEKIAEVEAFFGKIKVIQIDENFAKSEKELARFGKILLEVFQFIQNKYSEKKKQKGYLDFEDILLFTQDLITNDEVRDFLKSRYNYIMIDEYQDTNEIQYNIFMPILNYLRSGNLFIVGDEKQSIYMFRDAELEVFNRTKNEIVKEVDSSALLALPHSFRLGPQISLFTNTLFEELFKEPDLRFNEVEYNELICVKDKNEPGGVEILLSDCSDDGQLENELVAKRIANFISEKNNNGLGFSDIAVLCRKRSSFAELESVFLKYNIPFTIVGGKGFYQRQIIYDVYNYLSFLLNKNNDAALVGILRSPFYTISDTEIFYISLVNGKSFYDKLLGYAQSNNHISKLTKKLTGHLAIASKSDITFLVRTILHDTGYRAVIASRTNAHQELANIEKLIGISSSFSSQSFRTLYDFVNYLSGAIDSLDDESQAALATEDNSVKIMTLHQAKGLEYKAVFLYKCNEYTKEDRVKSKSVSIDKNMGVLTKVVLDGNYFQEYSAPPIVGLYNYIIRRKQISEIKRMLYVGVTRAANYLFLSASVKEGRLQNDSFLKFIVDGLKLNLDEPFHILKNKLKFMGAPENKFISEEVLIETNIPIIKKIDSAAVIEDKNADREEVQQKILIKPVDDSEKREIVSATKISVFMQCPVKFQLIYELGYSKIFKMIKKYRHNYEFNYNEDEETRFFGDVKGRVIHAVLESEKEKINIPPRVKDLLLEEINLHNMDENNIDEIESDIITDLNNFYDSEIHSYITGLQNSLNELEIYTEEKDYYLYGIIDKFALQNDKAIIIDYKTDNITPEEICEKGKNYLPQLKFYSYIISKLYKEIDKIELWLIFIKHPGKAVKHDIKKNDITEFGISINSIVNQIRNQKYIPNFEHCRQCHFYMDNKNCIKEY